MKRKVTSGEENRRYSRKKYQQVLMCQMGLFSEIWTDQREITGHPYSVCAASDSTGRSAGHRHEMFLCHNAYALVTRPSHAIHERNLRQLSLANQPETRASEGPYIHQHFWASAIHFLLCTNKPLFSIEFWTQKKTLARTSPLVERLLLTAAQKKVFYKQDCKVI